MEGNFANILEAIAAVVPDRAALIHDDQVVTWSALDSRSNALARRLLAEGAQVGDKLAIYSTNRPEWLEAVVAAFKARLVPVNVNYRYAEEELAYLLDNSDAVAIVYEQGYADNLEKLLPSLPKLKTRIVLGPPNGQALSYEDVAAGDGSRVELQRSGEDLLFIYTGGTTGMPKAVMWRQQDLWQALGSGADAFFGRPRPSDLAEHLREIQSDALRPRLLPACPLMHGTGLFTALSTLACGGSVVTVSTPKLDADALWSAAARHAVTNMAIVGDVFARPLLEALEKRSYDLTSMKVILSSGVMWSTETKKGLLAKVPQLILYDTLGSSEAVGFGASIMTAKREQRTASFKIGEKVQVLTEHGKPIQPGSGERGMLARTGPIPMGYYKDPAKSAETFREYDGVRYSIPGDFATVDHDGNIELLGRGSACINSGGEKIFPEEVEEVLKRHADVEDAAVVGLPDPKWGQAIHAVVTLADAAAIGAEDFEGSLRDHVRGLLAAYKVPKRIFVVESLGRSPSGKMDYKGVTAQAKRMVEGL